MAEHLDSRPEDGPWPHDGADSRPEREPADRTGPLGLEIGSLAVLDETPGEVPLPLGDIQAAARLPDAQGAERLKAAARGLVLREPVRSAQLGVIAGELPGLERLLAEAVAEQSIWSRRRRGAIGEKIANVAGPKLLRVANIPSLTLMLLGLGLVAGGLLAEVTNGLTVVEMAGELPDSSLVSRISFGIPFIAVVFAGFAAVPIILGPSKRRGIYVGLLFASFVMGGVGIYLYCAWMESRIDLEVFDAAAGPSSAAMIAGSILCGAMTVACGELMVLAARKSLFPYVIEDSEEYRAAARHNERADRIVRTASALIHRMRAMRSAIEAEDRAFVERCLNELQTLQQYIADRQTALKTELLPLPRALTSARPAHAAPAGAPGSPSANGAGSTVYPHA